MRGLMRSCAAILPVVAAAVASSCSGRAGTTDATADPRAENLRLVGYDDLQGRSAYQPVIHPYGDRRILFVGHHAGEALNPATGQVEVNGLSIVDVTDPAVPEYLVHVPPTGAEANGTQHVQVCSGSALPSADPDRVYLMRTNGTLSYEVLDVTDPHEPQFVTMIATTGVSSRPESQRGNRETHKSQWDCDSGIAYLNGTPAGWRVTRVLQAFDLADPTQPRHIRDFGLVGHEPTASGPFPEPQVAGLHQPFVNGDRMYLGYNSGGDGVLQILDRGRFLSGDPGASNPRAPTTRTTATCGRSICCSSSPSQGRSAARRIATRYSSSTSRTRRARSRSRRSRSRRQPVTSVTRAAASGRIPSTTPTIRGSTRSSSCSPTSTPGSA